MIDPPENASPETIKEIRKLAQVVASFAADIVSDSAVTNLGGLLADRMRYYRAENLLCLQDKFRKNIVAMGYSPEEYAESSKHVPIKHLVPLFEAAGLEEEDDLQTRWANMLANATDPNGAVDLKRKYISILDELETAEVLLFDVMCNEVTRKKSNLEDYKFDRENIARLLAINVEEIEIAFLSLLRQQCVSIGKFSTFQIGNETEKLDAADVGARFVTVSRMGYRLWQLTRPPNAK